MFHIPVKKLLKVSGILFYAYRRFSGHILSYIRRVAGEVPALCTSAEKERIQPFPVFHNFASAEATCPCNGCTHQYGCNRDIIVCISSFPLWPAGCFNAMHMLQIHLVCREISQRTQPSKCSRNFPTTRLYFRAVYLQKILSRWYCEWYRAIIYRAYVFMFLRSTEHKRNVYRATYFIIPKIVCAI